jgi:14-3-3 protein epsilon
MNEELKDMSREEAVYIAKVLIKSEKYDDMLKYMIYISDLGIEFTSEERNLFSIGFNQILGKTRTSYQKIEKLEEEEKNEKKKEKIIKYKEIISTEILKISKNVIKILDQNILPNSQKGSSKCFFLKMFIFINYQKEG